MFTKLIAAFFWLALSVPAMADHQYTFSRVVDYVDPYAASLGHYPTKGQVLDLDAMSPFQHLDGGYLIHVSHLYVQTAEMALATAFLETKHTYEKGKVLNGRKAKVVGMYEYVGLDGFKRTVYKLREVNVVQD